MKIAAIIARVLLGLAFTVFGLNAFLMFMKPEGPPPPPHAMEFAGAMMSTGYMQAVGAFQVVGGLLVLSGFFVPVGLTLLGPVIVNILFFHAFLNPVGWQPGAVMALLELFLIWYYRSAFAAIFQAKPTEQRGRLSFPS